MNPIRRHRTLVLERYTSSMWLCWDGGSDHTIVSSWEERPYTLWSKATTDDSPYYEDFDVRHVLTSSRSASCPHSDYNTSWFVSRASRVRARSRRPTLDLGTGPIACDLNGLHDFGGFIRLLNRRSKGSLSRLRNSEEAANKLPRRWSYLQVTR